MFKKLFSTAIIAGGLTFAAASNAATFNFADYADTLGEGGAPSFTFTEDKLTVDIEAALGYDPVTGIPQQFAYPYLDGKDRGLEAGLGVCKVVNSQMQCNPSNDDNLGNPEALAMWFSDGAGDKHVTITDILFRNIDHGTSFADGATFWVQIDGGPATEYSLTHNFSGGLHGQEFVFWAGNEIDAPYYISAITANVPAPAPLALLALGLLGVYTASRKNKQTA